MSASTGGVLVRTRRQLPQLTSYALVSAIVGLSLFASVVPSPLYKTYAELWHFSSLTLTLVYAVYAFGVLVALLLAGGVSDVVGRRPSLLVSLAALGVSTILYIAANSVAWLFAARALQGLATGVALSTASAAMLDFHPQRDPSATGTLNAIMTSAGAAVGVLISSALVQAGVAPRVLPYVVLFVFFAVAFVGALYLPEPVVSSGRFRLTPQRPHVPHEVRRPFLLAALAVVGSWAITGLSFSLGPELSSQLFGSTNAVVSGLGILMLAGTAVVFDLPIQRLSPRNATVVGSAALAVGSVLIALAAAWGSSAYFIAGSIVAGFGFGAAFLGGLRGLVTVIPGTSRGAVMAAFYIVAYLSLSIPAIVAGVVATHLGVRTTFEVFGSVVAGIALVVIVEALRGRPTIPIVIASEPISDTMAA